MTGEHGGGAGEAHPADSLHAARLENVDHAHALYVHVGPHLAIDRFTEDVGQVHHPVHVVALHRAQYLQGLQHVPLDDGHPAPYIIDPGQAGVFLEGDQVRLPLLFQQVPGKV